MSDSGCYHCGLPIPEGVELRVQIGAEARRMCCIGCQAVAKTIVDNGLADYYRTRDALPESQAISQADPQSGRREALPSVLEGLALYDNADFQKSFVREPGPHEREAAFWCSISAT